MTKFEVSFRDREPLVVEADHMTIDRDHAGKPLGFEFLRKPGDPATSIKPETVLYAVASEVVAVNTLPASGGSTSTPHGGYARSETSFDAASPLLGEFAREFGKWLGDRGDRRR